MGGVDRNEVECDEDHPGIDEEIRCIAEVPGTAALPTTAVNEDEDRSPCRSGRIKIERFDRRRTIPEPLRLAEAGPRGFAARREARLDLVAHRRVDELIVGRVQLGLVHIEPDLRTLVAGGRHGPPFREVNAMGATMISG